jgi:3-oxoadipate enol-lactonase
MPARWWPGTLRGEALAARLGRTAVTASIEIHHREWGTGPPVLALHGLGLESSSFTGLARGVADMGLRMLAADLPGFGQTPAPDAALTPAVLAGPVLELARRLEAKPLVMGMSLGARVALEAALLAPELFRGVVMLAAPLPKRERRWTLSGARLLSPELAMRIPVDRAWPYLKRLADRLEHGLAGGAEHDWFTRASKRTIYYISCPATRRAFVSAARELALDPAFGPRGVWTRLGQLSIPAAFVWGDQDRLIRMKDVPLVVELVPHAFQIHVPCAGHFDNGPHFRCLEQGALEGVSLVEAAARGSTRPAARSRAPRSIACRVGSEESEIAAAAAAATTGGPR